MRKNGFYKYLTAEDHIQILVNRKLSNMSVGNRPVKWIHIPNEGRRTPFEQYKFKAMGGKPGWMDLLIFEPNGKWQGLAIELKVNERDYLRKNGQIRKIQHLQNQLIKLKEFARDGWYCCFSGGYEKTEKIINTYFRHPDRLILPNYINE